MKQQKQYDLQDKSNTKNIRTYSRKTSSSSYLFLYFILFYLIFSGLLLRLQTLILLHHTQQHIPHIHYTHSHATFSRHCCCCNNVFFFFKFTFNLILIIISYLRRWKMTGNFWCLVLLLKTLFAKLSLLLIPVTLLSLH